MTNVLVIGAGGVGSVAVHKMASLVPSQFSIVLSSLSQHLGLQRLKQHRQERDNLMKK